MKKNIGPVAIALGVIALVTFVYFIYRASNPSAQGEYNPKHGKPAYLNSGGGSYGRAGGTGGGTYTPPSTNR